MKAFVAVACAFCAVSSALVRAPARQEKPWRGRVADGGSDALEQLWRREILEDAAPAERRRPSGTLAASAALALAAAAPAFALDGPPLPGAAPGVYEPRGVTPQDTVVFLIGTVPFLWAAWEFWRRIAVGASFGTGSDSIVIDPSLVDDADDDQVRRFGGRRVLGADAIWAARALMTVAAGSVALALYSATQI